MIKSAAKKLASKGAWGSTGEAAEDAIFDFVVLGFAEMHNLFFVVYSSEGKGRRGRGPSCDRAAGREGTRGGSSSSGD